MSDQLSLFGTSDGENFFMSEKWGLLTFHPAKSDGFTRAQDFTAFIAPLFDKYKSDTITLAIIHFNNYRYQ